MVGLRHLDGGLAHHHCQHYHHQFGVDDFADEGALPLKIECIGAALTVELLSNVPTEAQTRLLTGLKYCPICLPYQTAKTSFKNFEISANSSGCTECAMA